MAKYSLVLPAARPALYHAGCVPRPVQGLSLALSGLRNLMTPLTGVLALTAFLTGLGAAALAVPFVATVGATDGATDLPSMDWATRASRSDRSVSSALSRATFSLWVASSCLRASVSLPIERASEIISARVWLWDAVDMSGSTP